MLHIIGELLAILGVIGIIFFFIFVSYLILQLLMGGFDKVDSAFAKFFIGVGIILIMISIFVGKFGMWLIGR